MSVQINRKPFVSIMLAVPILVATACYSTTTAAQAKPGNEALERQKTLTVEAKGTHIPTPRAILSQIRADADPDECGDPAPKERVKVDAYSYRHGSFLVIAVWGRSSCFCSPTGNCAFWIFRTKNGRRYIRVLQTYMVREFGFLRSSFNGMPDLVLWSHNSAQIFPGALWKFDGSEYVSECRWEIVTTLEDVPANQLARPIESHVENNTCERKLEPESVTEKRD